MPSARVAAISLVALVACGQSSAQPGPSGGPLDGGRRDASPHGDAAPAIVCPSGTVPTNPIEYGLCAVAEAAAQRKKNVPVEVKLVTEAGMAQALAGAKLTLGARAESYVTFWHAGTLLVVGRDSVGAMYGALEIADALRAGDMPGTAPVVASPAISLRAANLFLTLPADGETAWWFLDPSFWTEYLDMMARARLDYLDLHGMYDLDTTLFPNALLWFATSKSYPDAGAPKSQRDEDLAMLNQIIAMAAVRGIKVGLMSYDSTLDPYEAGTVVATPAELQTYTLEAVVDLLARAPGLEYLGFRVGESGEPASFYQGTFIQGILASKSGVRAATRSWGATKAELLPLLQMSGPDTIVEVKMNGEQLGAPYVIAGGRMTGWAAYSYQDFLDPPSPYRFVFQVRSGGTHRIFRYASYARTQRAVLSLMMSPRAYGFTLEAAHAYLPQRDFYHLNPADSFSPWTFRRDELAYLLFGRLGYDPRTPESVFRAALAERVGTDGLWDPVQSASDIVPWIQQGNTCGPDQRDYAPELELGGTVAYWAAPAGAAPSQWSCGGYGNGPFDDFAVASPFDTATDLVHARGTSRVASVDVALTVLGDAAGARKASGVSVDASNPEARDVVRECGVLADLGDWFAHKLRAATALAVYQQTAASAWLTAATSETSASVAAWATLSTDTSYIASFDENMRMTPLGVMPFHWKSEQPRTADDTQSVQDVAREVKAMPPSFTGTLPNPLAWLGTARGDGVGLTSLKAAPAKGANAWTVTATFAHEVPSGATVNLLYRPFDSDAAGWASAPATGHGVNYSADATVPGSGAFFAVEIAGGAGVAHRYPDATVATPYVVMAP